MCECLCLYVQRVVINSECAYMVICMCEPVGIPIDKDISTYLNKYMPLCVVGLLISSRRSEDAQLHMWIQVMYLFVCLYT